MLSNETTNLLSRSSFWDEEVSLAALSPDGCYVTFVRPQKGIPCLWIKRPFEEESTARPLISEAHLREYQWTPDSRSIIYLLDDEDDKLCSLQIVDVVAAFSGPRPTPRELTTVLGASVKLYCVPDKQEDTVYVGINDRDPAWHDLYKIALETGAQHLLHTNLERIGAWYFDGDGRLLVVQRKMATSLRQELVLWEGARSHVLLSFRCTDFCRLLGFHQNGRRAYIETNVDAEFIQLLSLNLEDGKYQIADADPLSTNDLKTVVFSETGGEPLVTIYEGERLRHYFRDDGYREDFAWLQTRFPDYEIEIASRSRDERYWLLRIFADTEPGEFYLFSRSDRELTFQVRQHSALRRERLQQMHSIRYTASDGTSIPGYVILPERNQCGPPPLIVIPHGGPWIRDSWAYHATAQFLVNRGYAVLMPNFRGSAGYGKSFLNAGNGEWGRKMQDDITCGVVHLVNERAVDPRNVAIVGSSYGGYAALAASVFTPTLFRSAVAMACPSNLVSLLRAIPQEWETLRENLYCRIGDPTAEEGRQRLKDASPLFFVDNIQIPLLLVHGVKDGKVRCSEADQMVAALWKRGVPAQYLRLPDEGHTFTHPKNRSAVFAQVEQFFADHLGGECEPIGEQEQGRLNQIRVGANVSTANLAHARADSDL